MDGGQDTGRIKGGRWMRTAGRDRWVGVSDGSDQEGCGDSCMQMDERVWSVRSLLAV